MQIFSIKTKIDEMFYECIHISCINTYIFDLEFVFSLSLLLQNCPFSSPYRRILSKITANYLFLYVYIFFLETKQNKTVKTITNIELTSSLFSPLLLLSICRFIYFKFITLILNFGRLFRL